MMPSLRGLRRSRGLTLVEVAQQTGLAVRSIAEIEHGMRAFTVVDRAALADYYRVDPAELWVEMQTPVPTTLTLLPMNPRLHRHLASVVVLSTLSSVLLAQANLAPSESIVLAQTLGGAGRSAEQRAPMQQLTPEVESRNADSSNEVVAPASTSGEAQPPLPTAPPAPAPTAPPAPEAISLAPQEPPPAPPVEAPAPAPEVPAPAPASSVLMPLPPGGAYHQNVWAALEANGGALQHIVIAPGATWSFNRSIGDPSQLSLTSIYGVYGGGWCNLASYYVIALRPLFPPEAIQFMRHVDANGISLYGIADDDAVAIWNTNGTGGENDLIVHNTSDKTVTITATPVDGGIQIQVIPQ